MPIVDVPETPHVGCSLGRSFDSLASRTPVCDTLSLGAIFVPPIAPNDVGVKIPMCGRYTLSTLAQKAELFGVALEGVRSRGSVAPSEAVPILERVDGALTLGWANWGFTMGRKRIINARSESVFERPLFRRAAQKSRCLVLADGFIEWGKGPRPRPSFHVRRTDGGLFVMAGLVRHEADGRGETDRTMAILTTKANALVRPIHDRMPVVLEEQDALLWLNEDFDSVDTLGHLFDAASFDDWALIPSRVDALPPKSPQLSFGW